MFVLALMFITAVELISGKPLSAIFGGRGHAGPSLNNLVTPPPAPTTTPTSTTTTTSTTSPSSSTTTTTTAHDDQHHGADGQRDHDDVPGSGLDDHDHGAGVGATSTTTVPSAPWSAGYQPLNSAGRRSTKLAMPSLESSVWVTSSCPMASS